MIRGEPLFWVYYNKALIGCIFYVFHERHANEYQFIAIGNELNKWNKENSDVYKINEDNAIDLTNKEDENYVLVYNIICNRGKCGKI